MDLLQLVTAFVGARYTKSEKIVKAILLAMVAKKNCVLFGPGGHAKSEIAKAIFEGCFGWGPGMVPVKTFGQGTTEESLFGGMDIAELKSSGRQRFLFEGCWMDRRFSVWEELFDAPARVLTALKSTLTAGRYEADRVEDCHDLLTEAIVALTNLEPQEVADQGPDVEALVQRFPIQLRVAWKDYNSQDYLEMFRLLRSGRKVEANPELARRLLDEAQARAKEVSVDGMMPVLAELIAKAREQSDISPRTAVHALGLVAASAALNGRMEATKEDLLVLEFLPGMESLVENLRGELDAALARAEAERKLAEAEAKLQQLAAEAEAADTPIKALQAHKRLQVFGDEVANLKVTDALVDRRKAIRNAVEAKAAEALNRAVQAVRV